MSSSLASLFQQSGSAPAAKSLVELLRGERQVAALSTFWRQHARENHFNQYYFSPPQWAFLEKCNALKDDVVDVRNCALTAEYVSGLLVWLRFRTNVRELLVDTRYLTMSSRTSSPH